MGEPICCCDNSFDSWLVPAGFATRSDRPASNAGTAPPAAFWVAALSSPRNEAIWATTSGVRHYNGGEIDCHGVSPRMVIAGAVR